MTCTSRLTASTKLLLEENLRLRDSWGWRPPQRPTTSSHYAPEKLLPRRAEQMAGNQRQEGSPELALPKSAEQTHTRGRGKQADPEIQPPSFTPRRPTAGARHGGVTGGKRGS